MSEEKSSEILIEEEAADRVTKKEPSKTKGVPYKLSDKERKELPEYMRDLTVKEQEFVKLITEDAREAKEPVSAKFFVKKSKYEITQVDVSRFVTRPRVRNAIKECSKDLIFWPGFGQFMQGLMVGASKGNSACIDFLADFAEFKKGENVNEEEMLYRLLMKMKPADIIKVQERVAKAMSR